MWEFFNNHRRPDFEGIKNVKEGSKGIIFPQGERQITPEITPPSNIIKTEDTIRLWHEYGIEFYVYGIINYDDIFNKHHCTRFCYTYNPDKNSYRTCVEHNDADKFCQ